MLALDGKYYPVSVHYGTETELIEMRGHMTVLSALMRSCHAFCLPAGANIQQTYGLAQKASGIALDSALMLYDLPYAENDELWLFIKEEPQHDTH